MEAKIVLPSPNFEKICQKKIQQNKLEMIASSPKLPPPNLPNINQNVNLYKRMPYFSSPEGMLLPSSQQPPPMYGPRGSTIPPKYMTHKYRETGYHVRQHNENNYNVKINNKWNGPQYSCNNCDQYFFSQEHLDAHKSLYQRCTKENCNFIGLPETLSAHLDQHNSGFYDKIKNLNTPEEIEKWKSDRKKKYPTIINVELRRKLQQAKAKRGEKLSENKSRFGSSKDRRQISNYNTKNYRNEKRFNSIDQKDKKKIKRKANQSKHNLIFTDESKITTNDDNILRQFKGTSFLKDYKTEVKSKFEKELKINPLTSLLGMYGCSSDEDDSSDIDSDSDNDTIADGNENEKYESQSSSSTENLNLNQEDSNDIFENTFKKSTEENIEIDQKEGLIIQDSLNNDEDLYKDDNKTELILNSPLNACQNKSISDDEMPEEQPILREDLTKYTGDIIKESIAPNPNLNNNSEKIILSLKSGIIKRSVLDYSKLRTFRGQNTMLSKLLENDIRHERNVLLQCVRYVVKNNFFGIGQNK